MSRERDLRSVSNSQTYKFVDGWLNRPIAGPSDVRRLSYTMTEAGTKEFPADLTYSKLYTHWAQNSGYALTSGCEGSAGVLEPWYAKALYSAYSKFNDSLGDQSLWAVNINESNQALDMITHAGGKLFKAGRALMSLNVPAFTRALALKRDAIPTASLKKLRQVKVPKSKKTIEREHFSDLWLEWHFGWAPLLEDIDSAVRLLSSEPIDLAECVSGKGGASFLIRPTEMCELSGKVKVLISGTARITNPNSYLNERLGLVNPALIAWEAVPFSFVVDWFVPVGTFLNSLTLGRGLEFKDVFSTITYKVKATDRWSQYTIPGTVSYSDAVLEMKTSNRTCGMVSLPPPQLLPYKQLSATRAATAIALLRQFMTTGR